MQELTFPSYRVDPGTGLIRLGSKCQYPQRMCFLIFFRSKEIEMFARSPWGLVLPFQSDYAGKSQKLSLTKVHLGSKGV